MVREKPGIEFERIVTDIQRQFDPNAEVSHNERLTDRLGQKRQFDVVVRGKFAGQDILGVIECKDLSKKVGTPEIDAFVTKSQDINANLKIVVSRKGFSKPAIEKAKHYGIQTLSLLPDENSQCGFVVGGTKWCVDIYHWKQIVVKLYFAINPDEPVRFNAQDLTISGKEVLSWFTNYLIDNHSKDLNEGWTANIGVEFDKQQVVWANEQESYLCTGISFHANRVVEKKEKFVAWRGAGFYDWQKGQINVPPNSQLESHPVPADFMNWNDRKDDELERNGLIQIHIIGELEQFYKIEDAIELDIL